MSLCFLAIDGFMPQRPSKIDDNNFNYLYNVIMTNQEIIDNFNKNYKNILEFKKNNNIPYTDAEEGLIMEFINACIHLDDSSKQFVAIWKLLLIQM